MEHRGPFLGCWEWTGGKQAKGYGYLFKRDEEKLTHRRVWAAIYGPIPDGLYVLHRCDNPPCFRPDHLFLGTKADNNRDMVEKGRHAYLKRETCGNGHSWTAENTSWQVRPDGKRNRACRACMRERSVTAVKKRNEGRDDLVCPAGFRRHRFLGGDSCIKCGAPAPVWILERNRRSA